MDTMRIFRVIEYVGPAEAVARQIANSVHAEYRMPSGVTMRVSTVDDSIREFAERAFEGLQIIEGFPGQRDGN